MAIRTLVAKFIADTTQFEAGVKKAEKALTPFGQQLNHVKNISKTLNILRGGAVFAGVTGAAMALTRALDGINQSLLDIALGSKTAGEALREFFTTAPITGGLGQGIRGLTPMGARERAELAASESQREVAGLVTRDIETRIEQTRKLKDEENKLREAGKNRIQEMINLGRQQADERARELFDTQDKNRQKIADMIELGRRQRDEKAMEAYAESLSSVQNIIGRFVDPMEVIKKEIDEVNKAMKQGMLSIEDYKRTIAGLQVEMGEVAKSRMKTPDAHVGDFREISLSRTAIGGLSTASGGQQVMDPQLKETNRLLQRIESNIGRGSLSVYAP